ncbi:TerB family tellurite resistance protein [Flavobacteriaceae bacterium]|nr:TerB family tellurite resistance protein [Flavobacteriaceae bacterium]
MGILDSILGSSNKEDDKYVIFTACAFLVSSVDGEVSQPEGDFVVKYLRENIPSISENRVKKILDRGFKEGPGLVAKIIDFSENDKLEVIQLLIGVAASDGEFHGAEVAMIITISLNLGLNTKAISSFIIENYDVDTKQLEDGFSRFKKAMPD